MVFLLTSPSLASRAQEEIHNSSILEYLPFSKNVFDQIITALPLHGDTARILNRSDQATFESVDLRRTQWGAICTDLSTYLQMEPKLTSRSLLLSYYK